MQHFVAETEAQLQRVLALHRGTVANALDLEHLGEAFGHALHQVCDHGAGHAPHGARLLGVVCRLQNKAVVGLLDRHVVRHRELELTLRAFDLYMLAFERCRDLVRHLDRLFADA